MKKFLPKTLNNPAGFTLVELLVVISIIAILSVIGITIYSGVQKNARDARRRGDIDSISNAWETNHVNTSPFYPKLLPAWFASGAIPRDPQTTAAYTYTGADESNAKDTYKVCVTLEDATQYCKSSQQ